MISNAIILWKQTHYGCEPTKVEFRGSYPEDNPKYDVYEFELGEGEDAEIDYVVGFEGKFMGLTAYQWIPVKTWNDVKKLFESASKDDPDDMEGAMTHGS